MSGSTCFEECGKCPATHCASRKQAQRFSEAEQETVSACKDKQCGKRDGEAGFQMLVLSLTVGSALAVVLWVLSVAGGAGLHACSWLYYHGIFAAGWAAFALVSIVMSFTRDRIASCATACISLASISVLLVLWFEIEAAPYILGLSMLAGALIADSRKSTKLTPLPAISALCSLGFAMMCAARQDGFASVAVLVGAVAAAVIFFRWQAGLDGGKKAFLAAIACGVLALAVACSETYVCLGGTFLVFGSIELDPLLWVLLPVLVICSFRLLETVSVGSFADGVAMTLFVVLLAVLCALARTLTLVLIVSLAILLAMRQSEDKMKRQLALAFAAALAVGLVVANAGSIRAFFMPWSTGLFIGWEDMSVLGEGFLGAPQSWLRWLGEITSQGCWEHAGDVASASFVALAFGKAGALVSVFASIALLIQGAIFTLAKADEGESKTIAGLSLATLALLSLVAISFDFGLAPAPFAVMPFTSANPALLLAHAALATQGVMFRFSSGVLGVEEKDGSKGLCAYVQMLGRNALRHLEELA